MLHLVPAFVGPGNKGFRDLFPNEGEYLAGNYRACDGAPVDVGHRPHGSQVCQRQVAETDQVLTDHCDGRYAALRGVTEVSSVVLQLVGLEV